VHVPYGSVLTSTSKAVLSGKQVVGKTLTVKPSGFVAGTTYRYTWRRNGVPIAGKTNITARTYKLTSRDHGKTISVVVTGTKANYLTGAVYSNSSSKIVSHIIKAPKRLAVHGVLKVGAKIQIVATKGSWTKGAKLSCTWAYLVKGKWHTFAHTKKAVVKIPKKAKGHHLRFQQTGKKADYLTVMIGLTLARNVH
jgi:hypothetical protein